MSDWRRSLEDRKSHLDEATFYIEEALDQYLDPEAHNRLGDAKMTIEDVWHETESELAAINADWASVESDIESAVKDVDVILDEFEEAGFIDTEYHAVDYGKRIEKQYEPDDVPVVVDRVVKFCNHADSELHRMLDAVREMLEEKEGY